MPMSAIQKCASAAFFDAYASKVEPYEAEVYQYLQFDELGEFDAVYQRRDL